MELFPISINPVEIHGILVVSNTLICESSFQNKNNINLKVRKRLGKTHLKIFLVVGPLIGGGGGEKPPEPPKKKNFFYP